ncbi:hypothetical protein LTR37_006985 [Vermiconidia calcicola]|uniref:Uncharacterized protein n=1 Tax=Vermiconidia calcicola TaxID=1690605 RepID=A0ACC3NGU1_9PEZI|nr:hypothetical protein LTR37_006985 [Vermiconidia calcicola]
MDEYDYGDDDLDAIPDNTLQQLEHTALTSTQRAKGNVFKPQQKASIQTYGNTGLTRAGNANRNGWRPPQPRKAAPSPAQNAPPASAPEPPSSDYGFDDEDVIDLDEPSMAIQATSALPTRGRTEPPPPVPARNAQSRAKPPLDPETEAAFAAADAELGAQVPEQWKHAPHLQPRADENGDVSALQARLAELETEQARLRQSEQEARDAALSKEGEIAIVRANQEKATKEYERRLAVMQKLHADEAAKQKAELEAQRKEREKMETDNRFLQHDLAQEAERAERLTGPGKARAAPTGRVETPRKNKRTGLGDGFDDDEVRMVSPSKSREKSREQTPKVGAKRKRPAQDSPVAPLSFSRPVAEESVEQQQGVVEKVVVQDDGRYAFMQRMMNHRPYEGHERTVEALTKHAFPSDKERSLNSLFLDDIAFPVRSSETSLPSKLSLIMLKLWRRCLEEKYFKPIYLLLDMVRFALRLELSETVVQLLGQAVPICVRTIDLVAIPIARASLYASYASSTEYLSMQTDVAAHIDVDEMLDFLKQLCDAASLSAQYIEPFWRHVEFTSMLGMLNKAQPISQITTALQILSTSNLTTTFGPICQIDDDDGAQRQLKQERDTIERLTSLLFDMPEAPRDEPAYTNREIYELRIEVLGVLKALCLNEHGGLLLSQYRTAIGRLIRFLDGQVCKLYDTRPSLGLTPISNERSIHSLLIETVNTTVRLVYHLLRTHPESINLQQRLSAVKGGYHKFLISMTRIAFSDRLVLEEGLNEEVVEAAHQILDSVLSPEEGEAVVKAVETPRGTKGTSTEKDTESEGDEAMEEEPG